jgi:hypothetical protein
VKFEMKTIKRTISGKKPLIVTFTDGKRDFTIKCSMCNLATLQQFRQLVGDEMGIFFILSGFSSDRRRWREEWDEEVARAFHRGKEEENEAQPFTDTR